MEGQILFESLYFFIIAVVLAIHEIEIEGKNGWAKNLPTKEFNFERLPFLNGRSLTGYHLSLGALLALLFHLPFLYGKDWSIQAELFLISKVLIMTIVWDYLWFALNPDFGPSKFKRENIPWHDEYWIFGKIPALYLKVGSASLIVAATAAFISNNIFYLLDYLIFTGAVIFYTGLVIAKIKIH